MRLQQQRVAGWSVPDGAVRVSRGTPWGNPWRAGDRVALPSHEGSVLVTPELAVDLFAAWMLERPDSLEAAVDELAGFDLVCWCPIGEPCHAEWLLEQVRLRSEVRDLTFIK
ncbi:hypothetical protein ASF35_16505 [Aeromicrobium sp. Leaf291]|nr:hypothetical protein ASF35_16505 [Aeromicrobium sp. Leaf291]